MDIGHQPRAGHGSSTRVKPTQTQGPSEFVWLVYAAWVVMILSPHHLLASFGPASFGKIASAVLLPVLLITIMRIPSLLGSGRGWMLYPQFGLLLAVGLATLPFATNRLLGRQALQMLLVYWGVMVATTDSVRTPRQILPILAVFVWQFGWWALWSGSTGLVPWHPTLGNFDGYGGMMVAGAGACYWMGMGFKSRPRRLLAMLLAGFCVIGVIASFARGAFLALIVVAAVIWIRSPKKLLTLAAILLGTTVAVGGASMLFGGNLFWDEMRSAFTEGTSSGTGNQRWVLWTAATRVWLEHPILGVGAANFGVFASGFFMPYELEGFENPLALYGFNLHNAYMQVLSEFGLLGLLAFLWMHFDFFGRNRELRDPAAVALWQSRGGSQYCDLRYLSFALEAGMIASMLTNMVYAGLVEPWFYTVLAVNRAIWSVTHAVPGATRRAGAIRWGASRSSVHQGAP